MQEPYKNVRRKKNKERERKWFVYLYLRDCQTSATCYWWLKDRCSRMGHRPRLHLCSVAPHCCYFPKHMRECDAIHHLRSRINRARFPALLPPTFNKWNACGLLDFGNREPSIHKGGMCFCVKWTRFWIITTVHYWEFSRLQVWWLPGLSDLPACPSIL